MAVILVLLGFWVLYLVVFAVMVVRENMRSGIRTCSCGRWALPDDHVSHLDGRGVTHEEHRCYPRGS